MKDYVNPTYNAYTEIDVPPEVVSLVEEKIDLFLTLQRTAYRLRKVDHTLAGMQFSNTIPDNFAFMIKDNGALDKCVEVLDKEAFEPENKRFNEIIQNLIK